MKRIVFGGGIVALIVIVALVAAVWTPYDPLDIDLAHRLAGPSSAHWFGTDRYGRDVLSLVMAGARITLYVGALAVGISAVVGTILGMIGGRFIMAAMDILQAFPALLLAIVFGAISEPSTTSAIIAIGVAGIPGFARVARQGTMRVLTEDYVAAARISGVSRLGIACRHVWPNISGMLIVQASVAFAMAVLAEAALSFLGLGTPPLVPSWGRMLHDAQVWLETAPGLVLVPGAAIALTVLGFNVLGDGLRDELDPTIRTRGAARATR